MSVIAELLMVVGSAVAVLAGIGVVRFETAYARLHAAGKASPVAFFVAALGAGLEFGVDGGAGYLLIGAAAMVLTLPVGVHLLFRAVYRTTPGEHLVVDALATPNTTADHPET